MPFSNSYSRTILENLSGKFVGLHTDSPDETNEVNATGYTRKPMTLGFVDDRNCFNDSDIVFDTALYDWGVIKYIAIYESATPTSGETPLYYVAGKQSLNILTNDNYVIPTNYFQIRM